MLTSCEVTVPLALTRSLAVVVAAQTALALLLAVIGIHAGQLLHDAVPSAIRAGVASGVGTVSWVLFLPFSVFVGWLARAQGVQQSGWVLTAAALLVGIPGSPLPGAAPFSCPRAPRHRETFAPNPHPPTWRPEN